MPTLARRIVRSALAMLVVATAAAAAPPASTIDDWSDAIWDAARTGKRSTVDAMLASVPDGQATSAIQNLRSAIALRNQHGADTKRAVEEKRVEKLQEMKDAIAAGQAAKALVAGAYLKYLSDEWKTQVQSADIQELVSFAEKKVAAARAAGDWVLAEDLLVRLRTLYEGTPLKAQYQHFDDVLETDVSPRVTLILEYAPRTWHGLRKAQYERLDAKDRRVPFPPFSEKGADDWKSQLEGLNESMLTDALSQIAGQHLEHVGWKPLIEGGLTMVKLLSTTPALKENFPTLGDPMVASAFADSVQAQRDAIKLLKPSEVDSRTFGRVLTGLRKANDQTVRLPFEVIIREFGNGAMSTMTHDFEDPYTEIVWPDRIRRFNQAIKGNFVGVGVLIRHNDNREIFIVNPLDGSPAMRAGLMAGDKITSVNGVPTADWALDRAVEAITGPAGTTVTLSIARAGEKKDDPVTAFDVPLVRQRIKMYSVQGWRKTGHNQRSEPIWDWFIDPDSGIGYLSLTGFNEDTYSDFVNALNAMKQERALQGLVLDLRGNPGGLMQCAIRVANTFMKSGRIVSVEDRNKVERQATDANPTQAALADLPTVVLINEGSASAAEIVSGALEASDTAVVVGERSFGKGSVQEVHPIGGRGSGAEGNVKITVQHYLLPPKPGEAKGRLVHKRPGAEDWGVVPDYIVRLTPMQMDEVNKIRASANGLPPDIDDPNLQPPSEGTDPASATPAKAKREKREPAELIQKGYDAQLETALILLQSRLLKEAEQQVASRGMRAPSAQSSNTTAAKPVSPKSSL